MPILLNAYQSLISYLKCSLISGYGLISVYTAISVAVCFVVWLQFSGLRRSNKRLPPGSLGALPLLGESLEFLRLTSAGKLREFLSVRTAKHGAVFKTSLFGRPTLVDVGGQALNKFLFANENKLVVDRWPRPVIKLMGEHSLLTKHGAAHKRLRLAFSSFLRPEALQNFVQQTEATVLDFFATHFDGREELTVNPLMKTFSFSLACAFLLGIRDPAHARHLFSLFSTVIKGIISLPINLPGTRYHAAIIARRALGHELQVIISKRRRDLQHGLASPVQDSLSYLIMEKDENDKPLLTDLEIRDNLVTILSAGHDTTAAVLTVLFKFLVENPSHFQELVTEQEQIASTKKPGQELNWQDVQKMRVSWRFIQETMRIIPPVDFAFREVIKEFEYSGYRIPEGWKVFWTPQSSHMKPDVFPQPHMFDPSRFEGSGPPPFSFVPFGGGARSCPGMEFARMSMLLFLHHLVRKYRWTLMVPNEPIVNNPSPMPQQGLPIKLTLLMNEVKA